MTETNLVILSKFENERSIYPSEDLILCDEHYEMVEEEMKGNYEVTRHRSSMPKGFCNICSPPDYGDHN
jgi:hypothetical protein